MVTATRAQLNDFRATFAGEIVTPDASGYDDARRVWNATFDRRPALVVRPSSVNDVVAALRFGRERELEIAVRGGGHSALRHAFGGGKAKWGWSRRRVGRRLRGRRDRLIPCRAFAGRDAGAQAPEENPDDR